MVIGIIIGLLLIFLGTIVIDLIFLIQEPKPYEDLYQWLNYIHMSLWMLGSMITTLSIIIPGVFIRSLPPAVRAGMIGGGVIALIISVNYANGLAEITSYYHY